jgi:hypothetical protein
MGLAVLFGATVDMLRYRAPCITASRIELSVVRTSVKLEVRPVVADGDHDHEPKFLDTTVLIVLPDTHSSTPH